MVTIKLPYKTETSEDSEKVLSYMKQYSSCLHFMYNRVLDGISETEIKHLPINNVNLLDSWFKQSCVKEAVQINNSNKGEKVIFGGKNNFLKRVKGKISNEEFQIKKLSPIYSIGEAKNPGIKGNRKFHIEENLKIITFKPNRNERINLILPKLSKNYQKDLIKLYELQELRQTSITYKLDLNYIYITFDENKLSEVSERSSILNRIMGIDLNPNYVGWSVVDWKGENDFKVIDSGVYSIKVINDKEREFKKQNLNSSDSKRIKYNNKREFEIFQISKLLIKKCLHHKVDVLSLENLNMKSGDKGKGLGYNRLVNNNWLRNDLVNNLTKRCNLEKIKILLVKAEYSSFFGNLIYRSLRFPDMILSSIEIGRRAHEYNNQYIKKIKKIKKNIVFPDIGLVKDLAIKSLEEFNIKFQFNDWMELYSEIKTLDIKYRVSIDSLKYQLFSSQKYNNSVKILTDFY